MRFALVFLVGCAASDTIPRAESARSIVLREEAEIAAGAERVWQALSDISSYEKWNPWLVRAWGSLERGGTVWAEVLLDDERRKAEHRVLIVEPNLRLCWRDAGWTTAFVYGQRCRFLDRLADGRTRLRQELLLEGPFRDTAIEKYGASLRNGLRAETQALKQRVEGN